MTLNAMLRHVMAIIRGGGEFKSNYVIIVGIDLNISYVLYGQTPFRGQDVDATAHDDILFFFDSHRK